MATVDEIDKQIAQLKERRAAVVARERARERKRDARCKILLGGGLLALVRDGDAQAAQVYSRIRDTLDERSAQAFKGWTGEPIRTTQTSEDSP